MGNPDRDWSSNELRWGMKRSFIDYIRSLPDGVVVRSTVLPIAARTRTSLIGRWLRRRPPLV